MGTFGLPNLLGVQRIGMCGCEEPERVRDSDVSRVSYLRHGAFGLPNLLGGSASECVGVKNPKKLGTPMCHACLVGEMLIEADEG